jgi:glycosyltransferase involved in cell wall biosynthesis
VRWLSLFSSPFFHPTVLVDRERLETYGLRYDSSYLESEDYELWTRLLQLGDGANVAEPLVFKRVHAGQASQRRGNVQQSFQREIALREITRVAPELSEKEAELAWAFGAGRETDGDRDAYLALLHTFERTYGLDSEMRAMVARRLGRFTPALGLRRVRRLVDQRIAQRRAPSTSTRVVVVSPEPTPYRAPLFDRIAALRELDLTVIYAAHTVAGRTWRVEPRHRAVFLSGVRAPGLRRLLRHDYPLTLGIARALRRARPEVVVVSGWSTFASQAAIVWSRARHVPYVLLVESHDLGPRPRWRRAVKGAVASRIIRGAASVLVVGAAARASVVARGARPERVRVFANTIDVARWIGRAERAPARPHDAVVVLSVGRLVREKGLDVLVRASAAAGVELVLAGDGPERENLLRLGQRLGVNLSIIGDVPEEKVSRQYAAADTFALLSLQETWGVVVNEAAASGLPLVLSDRVGAAYDLLRDGENGFLVPAEDAGAAAEALRKLAADADLRRRMGERSRELVRDWGYEPSVENFLAAVREATSR